MRPIHAGRSRHSPSALIPPGAGGSQGGVWVATGQPQPCSLALANDAGIAFLQGSVSPGMGRARRQPRIAGTTFQCHRMMQHLQKRCRLPPTDGGGVTGAK